MPGLLAQISNKLVQPAVRRRAAAVVNPMEQAELIALARELLHGMEQFVISTPDLDTERFLRRLRGTAAGLTPHSDRPTLELFRQWAQSAIAAFAALQRRYVTEREAEMWRVLDAYRRVDEERTESDTTHRMELMAAHHRMWSSTRIADLKEMREQLTAELQRARRMMEDKDREDKDRVNALAQEVARLEAALAAAKGHADFDALTGLYHRGAFMDRLRRLMEERQPLSLALLDLDDLSTINESLGHAAGDRLLHQLAMQLNRLSRSTDIVARYAGDLYCLASPGVDAEQLSKRLIPAMARRHMELEVDGRQCSALLSMSVGVADWVRGETAEALFTRAEKAMRTAKRSGKGQIRIAP